MPDTKISALTAASSVAGADVVPIIQSGANKKATVSQIAIATAEHPGYVAGRWYFPQIAATIANGAAVGLNTIIFSPVFILKPITIDALAAYVPTAVSGANCQLAVYSNDPTTVTPTGNALCATASLSLATAGNVIGAVTPVALAPGLYWLAVNRDTAAALTAYTAPGGSDIAALIGVAAANPFTAVNDFRPLRGFTQTYGTWPDMTGQSLGSAVNTTNGALIAFRAA